MRLQIPLKFEVIGPEQTIDVRMKISIFLHWKSLIKANCDMEGDLTFASIAHHQDFARVLLGMSEEYKEVPLPRIIAVYEK